MANQIPKIFGIEMRSCEDGTAWALKDVIIRSGEDGFYYYICFTEKTHRGRTHGLGSATQALENIISSIRKQANELGT
jgi:hypothetical protein